MTFQPTTLLASETRIVDSRHTGRTYAITISLPLGYAKATDEVWPFDRTPPQWPVVYVLDGNWYAAMVAGMIRSMAWCGSITDAIVVGIGYVEGDDAIEAFRESITRRNLDLTPVRIESEEAAMAAHHQRPTPSGDAANFHHFIQDELIPLIEQAYRADPAKRILVGHSYGGLFALFALFKTPQLFDTWIVGSPTLSYGDRATFVQEEAFALQHNALPTKLYLFMAGDEEFVDDTTLTDTLRFTAILQSRRYEGLTLTKQIFTDQNHCEVAVLGFQGGLKVALKS